MATIESSLLNIGYLETLSYQQTPLHRLDPRAKLLTTVVFIIAVVSFGKYEITGLIPFMIYPVALIAVGNLPPGYLARKILLAAPFAFFIGIFNPLKPRTCRPTPWCRWSSPPASPCRSFRPALWWRSPRSRRAAVGR